MAATQKFRALVADFLGTFATEFPDVPDDQADQAAVQVAHGYDLQVRLAQTFGRQEQREQDQEVLLILRNGTDSIVRFRFDRETETLHAEHVLDDKSEALKSSLVIKQDLSVEHFNRIAMDGIDILIDVFGAKSDSKIEIVAPLAPDFDEDAVMALLEGIGRRGAENEPGYTRPEGEDCDPDFFALYDAIQTVLRPIARESPFPGGDYFLVDDDWGNGQQKIEISKYEMLHPDVIHALRKLLDRFPRWEIVIGTGEPGWPPMGLTIKRHEIIDGLLREYLPAECLLYQYDDARVGTEND